MSTRIPYTFRPVSTKPGVKHLSAKELLFLAIRASRKILPNRLTSALSERLRQLRREKGEFSTDLSPIEGMMVESVEKAPANESAIVSILMASFSAAKQRQSEISRLYLPGAEWKKILESQWSRYYPAINRQDLDVVAAFLRNFFRNEGVSGFWDGDRTFDSFATLDGPASLARASMMRRQFEAWRTALPNVPVAELDAPRIGNPWGYILEGTLLYEAIFEYHYQANYFATLLSGVSKPVIIEIGGGFGGLGYQIIKHIPHVKYIGFDLPENVFLQSYYLSCAFPELKILTYDKSMAELTDDTIAPYDIILLPNFMLPKVASAIADLIVNVRSLSEMLVETINEYFRQIDRLSRLFFFHENLFKDRHDGLHGIPSAEFPALSNLIQVAESESRWPTCQKDSGYPCHENLYIHRSALMR